MVLLEKLLKFRKQLHSLAELSGKEVKTSELIEKILIKTKPDEILKNIGGYGIAAVYNGVKMKPTIMFRAELDALPIDEVNDIFYKSINEGVSHKCGHDGHMTILLGLAHQLKNLIENMPCRVVLLFQPAEETAEGANKVIHDRKFKKIRPDYIFGLHNLPGFDSGSIIIKDGVFASASSGMVIELEGMTSHAGHPENGKNPVMAMTDIIHGLMALPSMNTKLENPANITIIHAKLGEVAFGTSPGHAVIMATLRSHNNDDLELLSEKAKKLVKGIAETYELDYDISWKEIFPATINDKKCTRIISKAAQNLKYKLENVSEIFPWSEDFGWYTKEIKGAFFGIGSGLTYPQLHNPHYEFPDALIAPGIEILKEIISETLLNK